MGSEVAAYTLQHPPPERKPFEGFGKECNTATPIFLPCERCWVRARHPQGVARGITRRPAVSVTVTEAEWFGPRH